jgi:hypothetical protein
VSGVEQHAIGAAGDLKVAIRFEFGGGLAIDNLVGAENVIAVMHDDMAVEGDRVANPGLAVGIQLNRHSARRSWLRLRNGNHLLTGVVRQLRGRFADWSGNDDRSG